MEGRLNDTSKDGERFKADIVSMLDQAKKIDHVGCADYYREWAERTGEIPYCRGYAVRVGEIPCSWNGPCTTKRFHTPWSEASINKALKHLAPHLIYCEGHYSDDRGYDKPKGVVRLMPWAVLPK
jgi:hypothetical protein